MTITLNNRKETFPPAEMSIAQIMNVKQFHFKMLIVKLNGKLIPRESWTLTLVRDADRLDIIHLVSGG
ncbi:MAG: sulfur carrier protein ThiS [Bacteroidales bacterium]|jgi:sulfur carrier protein|nr:sulfur carrier protein ThiS [Bacteroidales bacterium]MDD2264244.1 sulfur carrier protein ThiS [Bacteroidales bacterium]MDD2831478.1 sulfur carrier protein ThiS [Bacteroidales bacterium]MDD3208472.1 sulfur carrier protein ThiS [Bacteroidales bacterium]MDD3697115.1 sulfur carrier protein ThiS [Bacteroidales bacterium]